MKLGNSIAISFAFAGAAFTAAIFCAMDGSWLVATLNAGSALLNLSNGLDALKEVQ